MKPNIEKVLNTLLFVEDFTDYRSHSTLFANFMQKFFDFKKIALRDSLIVGQNEASDAFEVSILR